MSFSRFQKEYWASRALNIEDGRSVSIADPWQRDLELAFILECLDVKDEVLEVGCGNGEMSRFIAPAVRSLTSIDLSPEMIERAKAVTGQGRDAVFSVGDATQLEFPDETFDAVVCARVLINMPDRILQERGVSEFSRVLRPGGRLVLLEGALEAFGQLNAQRSQLGLGSLSPAPVNLYLDEDFFSGVIAESFVRQRAYSNGMYDLMTRVVAPYATEDLESDFFDRLRTSLAQVLVELPDDGLEIFSRVRGGCYVKTS